MSKLKENLKMPKLILPKVKTKLDILEDENIYFENINDFDKFLENLENKEK